MIEATDFLTLAETWIQEDSEAEWRCAVSRAYYAAFHTTRAFLRDLGFSVPRADRAHAYLWLRLSNSGHPLVQLAGSDLSVLRRDRNRADYDIEAPLIHAAAFIQVETASKIIQILTDARNDPVRTAITDAMKIYERDVLKETTWRS